MPPQISIETKTSIYACCLSNHIPEVYIFSMKYLVFRKQVWCRAVVRMGATGALAPVNFKQRVLSTRPETDFLCSQLKLQRFL